MNLLAVFINAFNVWLREPILNWTWKLKWTGFVNPDTESFIEKITPAAKAMEAVYAIPWKFAMVQAYHESRYGQSLLTREANNLFGVTGDTWYTEGKPVLWIQTTEYNKDKVPFEIKRPFRKYDSWQESLEDWAELIHRRYPLALAAAMAGHFDDFARALQVEGYATDPKYATQLIALNSDLESIG